MDMQHSIDWALGNFSNEFIKDVRKVLWEENDPNKAYTMLMELKEELEDIEED